MAFDQLSYLNSTSVNCVSRNSFAPFKDRFSINSGFNSEFFWQAKNVNEKRTVACNIIFFIKKGFCKYNLPPHYYNTSYSGIF